MYASSKELRSRGLPHPCRRKSGDAFWTPTTIAYLMRRWPNSAGWKRKAALAGALPVMFAVDDPERIERECLWALPRRVAVKYLPPCRVQANRGAEWFTPERIADLERRFPKPGARWRKTLAELRAEVGSTPRLNVGFGVDCAHKRRSPSGLLCAHSGRSVPRHRCPKADIRLEGMQVYNGVDLRRSAFRGEDKNRTFVWWLDRADRAGISGRDDALVPVGHTSQLIWNYFVEPTSQAAAAERIAQLIIDKLKVLDQPSPSSSMNAGLSRQTPRRGGPLMVKAV